MYSYMLCEACDCDMMRMTDIYLYTVYNEWGKENNLRDVFGARRTEYIDSNASKYSVLYSVCEDWWADD